MPSRDELKSLIDQVPEGRLATVEAMLQAQLRPPTPPPPEMERLRERGREYRQLVEKRYSDIQKPGTIGGMAGGGSFGVHNGTPFGRNSFSYWDGKAMVQQTLQSFDGQDIEIMERFSIDEERTKLTCTIELSSGGRTVRHEEQFPAK